jgi:hypothetical protein
VPSLLAVARTDYRLACHSLERWQYDWLASLPQDPPGAPAPDDPGLAAWLPTALRLGLAAA